MTLKPATDDAKAMKTQIPPLPASRFPLRVKGEG